ncbi:MAG: helix-turn-helix domain-containing protein [Candidatus Obscuribacterales bacterium]|nr:helix-turn-helix domain-containing protein [Candidatus Obscuribacterales bacterium]
MEFFMRHPGEVFSVDALLERVWPLDSERSPEGVRTLIKRLRDKIDYRDETLIQNVHGRGYKLVPPTE